MPTENKIDRVKRIRALAREIDYLERLIKKIPHGVVVDWANDYSTGKARPITLLGQSDREGYRCRIEKTIDALNWEMHEAEDLIMSCHDPITRRIIRMRYVEGMTVEAVATETGYSEDSIKWRQRVFFTKL